MKKFILAMSIALLFAAPAGAHEEELAPGSEACMEKAAGVTDAMIDCLTSATEYWDKKLNANYKAARKQCADSGHPGECEQALVKAQRLWIQYRDATMPVLGYLGGGGSLDRLVQAEFMAQETKKQAQLLEQ